MAAPAEPTRIASRRTSFSAFQSAARKASSEDKTNSGSTENEAPPTARGTEDALEDERQVVCVYVGQARTQTSDLALDADRELFRIERPRALGGHGHSHHSPSVGRGIVGCCAHLRL